MNKILVKKDETADILALCKQHKVKEPEVKLEFATLTRDMFKDNEVILKKYFRNANGQDCYYANLLAFRDIPEINLYKIKKALKRDFGKPVSLAGYTYDPEHYRFNNDYIQDEYEEDLFKFKTQAEEDAEFEADRRNRIEPIDFNAMESLYTVLYKGIKARLVMILNLDTIPGILNNALDCYFKGVNCSVSNDAMHAKIADLRALLEDPEVIEWLKTKPTDMSFDRFDYVTTYQKVLRQLSDIRDESLEYMRDLVDNSEDLYQEEIMAHDYPEFESYIDNSLDDDDDYLVNNEIFD